jgi:D-3-phosphoglycerate dehydrogenase
MEMKLLVTARMMPEDMARLRAMFTEIEVAGWGLDRVKLDEEQMIARLRNKDAAIIEFEPMTERVIAALPGLKLIACCRNEPEANVDVEAATARGIPVLSGAGRNAVSVAEYTFGLLLSLSRNIAKTDYLLKRTDEITGLAYSGNDQLKGRPSEWSLDANAPFNRYGGPELYGKNFGVVGLGTIGRVVASMGKAFGMNLLVFDPYVSEQAIREQVGGRKVSLEELMGEADFVSLHAKVTPETIGLVDRRTLSMMKPGAYLVNTARAALMDYDALYDVLKEGKIAGAALDVFTEEPITGDNPFLKLDNVLLTPHLAGSSHDIPRHHSKLITDDVIRFYSGERPQRMMNREVFIF